jgi:Na+-translocating ferredoxin:NAD+ oxidoreductase RnfG subunit
VKRNKQKAEWILAIFALITIAFSWYIGKKLKISEVDQSVFKVLPYHESKIQRMENGVYKVTSNDLATVFLTTGTGKGYAGPIKVLVGYSHSKTITSINILDSKETTSYLQKVFNRKYLENFHSLHLSRLNRLNFSPDAISGATRTSEGIAQAIKSATSKLANYHSIDFEPEDVPQPVSFGKKEIIVLLLFVLGLLARVKSFRLKEHLTWTTLILGLIFLGFVYNEPISMTRIHSLLLGFWPSWHNELHIYFLVFGVAIILLTTGKNPYCHAMCPLGASQKLLGKIGHAKTVNLKQKYFWVWMQRSFAWISILLALIFRNPAISEYEIHSALFQFTGTHWLFLIMGLTIIISIFVSKPWCNFLCPIRAIFDFMHLFRKKLKRIKR